MSITPDYAARLFEHAPHVALVLGTDLSVIGANAAARRFLNGGPDGVAGKRLFDLLPPPVGTGETWQDRLRASYAVLRSTRHSVTLMLPARDGIGAGTGTVGTPVDSAGAASMPADGAAQSGILSPSAIWHICHAPVLDDDGVLIAIATYAQALEGVEIAIAQVSGFATTQRAAVPPVTVRDTYHAASSAAGAGAGVQPAAAQAGGNTNPAHRANLNILLVEDSDDLRMATCEQLEFLGHRVTSVADAELAMRQLEVSSFDLLFTDLTLPKMTGAELARQVLHQAQPMQVVITSGYGRALANAQSLDALFLPKPYRFPDLEDVLAKVKARLGQAPG